MGEGGGEHRIILTKFGCLIISLYCINSDLLKKMYCIDIIRDHCETEIQNDLPEPLY